jgi:hypothetical protein
LQVSSKYNLYHFFRHDQDIFQDIDTLVSVLASYILG